MSRINRSAWLRYSASVGAVGMALSLKFLLIPIVTQDAPFLLFFTAVMVAAWFGGLGPGLLATFLAAIFNLYFFMRPFQQFAIANPGQPPQLALFIIEGICISLICAKWQAARQRAEASDREARSLERKILEIGEAEQRRIGHDLHDGLGQHLTGIALLSRRLQQRLAAENSTHAEDATKITGLAKTAVEWTHDLCRSLSPPALESQGLAEGLQSLAANAENVFNIDCSFEQSGEAECRDVSVAAHLYRIAQEAISNAVKHGKAKRVQIRLFPGDNEIRMQIIDDGSGIDPSVERPDGMGLRIMRHRAQMIGAQMQIEQRGPAANGSGGVGTIVTCIYRPPAQDGTFTQDLDNGDEHISAIGQQGQGKGDARGGSPRATPGIG